MSIHRSSINSDLPSCDESVLSQFTANSSSVTVVDTLSCRYAGHRVTYCLQLVADECQSSVAMQTVESE